MTMPRDALSPFFAPKGREADMNELITMPRDLAERILSYLEAIQDEGPPGEGWKSERLELDIKIVSEILNEPPASATP